MKKYMDEKNRFDLNRARLIVYSHGEYLGTGKKLGTFGYSVKKSKKQGKKTAEKMEKKCRFSGGGCRKGFLW